MDVLDFKGQTGDSYPLIISDPQGKLVVSIRSDGKVTYGKGYKWRYRLTAFLFWRAVTRVIHEWGGQV